MRSWLVGPRPHPFRVVILWGFGVVCMNTGKVVWRDIGRTWVWDIIVENHKILTVRLAIMSMMTRARVTWVFIFRPLCITNIALKCGIRLFVDLFKPFNRSARLGELYFNLMLYHNHMIGGGNIRQNKLDHEVIEFESVFSSHMILLWSWNRSSRLTGHPEYVPTSLTVMSYIETGCRKCEDLARNVATVVNRPNAVSWELDGIRFMMIVSCHTRTGWSITETRGPWNRCALSKVTLFRFRFFFSRPRLGPIRSFASHVVKIEIA